MKIYTQGGFGSITYFNDTLWVNLPDHVNVGVARGVLPTPPTGMAHVLQDSDKAMIKSTGITFFAAIVCTMVALQHPLRAQTQAASVSVNGFRPMAVVVSQLEQLSGIPINYEDLRCDFVGDQTIIQGAYTAAQQAMAVKNGVVGPLVDIAPRGGSLSATITVNASGKLSDTSAVASALNSVLSAYSGSGLPGAFGLEQYNGTFFVAPNSQRDQTGATITVPPV